MKMLKQVMPDSAKMTLLTEAPNAYYSGMLPGAISRNNYIIFKQSIKSLNRSIQRWGYLNSIETPSTLV